MTSILNLIAILNSAHVSSLWLCSEKVRAVTASLSFFFQDFLPASHPLYLSSHTLSRVYICRSLCEGVTTQFTSFRKVSRIHSPHYHRVFSTRLNIECIHQHSLITLEYLRTYDLHFKTKAALVSDLVVFTTSFFRIYLYWRLFLHCCWNLRAILKQRRRKLQKQHFFYNCVL